MTSGMWPVLHQTAAAVAAWVIAEHLIDHHQPIFAPIAALVGLNASRGDLRRGQQLGDRKIDVAYTQLHRDADGRARVRLTDPDGTTTTLWADEAYPYLEIFTGDTLPEADRRRTGLGVEPMTCAPYAFNSRTGLTVLQPGETHQARWGIEPFLEPFPQSG
ncbi:aldose epimerase family protein [Streptomyces sp. NBC_00443]|uniref:aldose epimerase family protein n=1 Tax=Streptomyces sp. NBC_00443 TaxID=2975743 RepID=UPI002E2371A4